MFKLKMTRMDPSHYSIGDIIPPGRKIYYKYTLDQADTLWRYEPSEFLLDCYLKIVEECVDNEGVEYFTTIWNYGENREATMYIRKDKLGPKPI